MSKKTPPSNNFLTGRRHHDASSDVPFTVKNVDFLYEYETLHQLIFIFFVLNQRNPRCKFIEKKSFFNLCIFIGEPEGIFTKGVFSVAFGSCRKIGGARVRLGEKVDVCISLFASIKKKKLEIEKSYYYTK